VLLLAAYALVIWRSGHETRQLVQTFEQLGGRVEIQHIGPFGYRSSLFERFDLFPRVTEIVWLDVAEETQEFTPELARSISSQPYLEVLALLSPSVTDEVVEELSKSDSVQLLDISGSNISDQSLRDVSQMKSLEDLRITGTNISKNGLLYLSKMRLDSIALMETPVAEHSEAEIRTLLPNASSIFLKFPYDEFHDVLNSLQ